jgi:hypothetical protein
VPAPRFEHCCERGRRWLLMDEQGCCAGGCDCGC